MPRMPRLKSTTGIYHIIMRGINRQTLFEEEEDCIKFRQTLQKYREICQYKLYAYCLMGNHLHLLLQEGKEPLETVMRRICGSYVLWYNKKYDRIGYLFQDRFKSEPVEDDAYFLTAIRYIFQNPVKAGIVTETKKYRWSNYSDYIGKSNHTDTGFVLDIFHQDRQKALKLFMGYINQVNDDQCLDIEEKSQMTDKDAMKIVKEHCRIEHGNELQTFDSSRRNLCIKDLKEQYGLSIRQIERLTGISRGIIQRA